MHSLTAPKRTIERNPAPQPGQLQAIELLDDDLIVSAGAGSGKTWVLTERYIEMLNHGARPEQIVAITFTKKAAAEMKGRIRKAIVRMEETTDSEQEAAYWKACRQELERAVITTIHGFCTRLLRDAPLEAGVDPQFAVLDEKEATLMERQLFADTVDEWLSAPESASAAEHVFRELGSRRDVLETALALHEQMRTYDVQKDYILNETFAVLDQRKKRFCDLREQLLQLAATCQNIVQQLLNGNNKPANYLTDALNWLEQFGSSINQTEDWNGLYDTTLTDRFVTLKASMWRNNGPDDLKNVHSQLKQLIGEWLLHTEAAGYRDFLRSVLELTCHAADKYKDAKRREQALDFHDLEQLVLDMLQRHPEVAERWQRTLRYVMVDEFQDTNSLQKSILDQLTGEGGHVKRFVVGDGKQSIYKFRGADVAVFNRTGSEIREQGGTAVSLDVNFRTQYRLITYINSLFQFLMNEGADTADYAVTYEPLVAHRRPPHTHPAVELLATSIEQESRNDSKQVEAGRVAKRVRLMVQRAEPLIWSEHGDASASHPVTYGDIALLLATRTHLQTYEQALRDEGIPYIIVGGRGFYDKQEVLDVLNVLKLVQNRDDELALLAFLRAPFVHLSDETLYWLTREQRLSQAFFRLELPPAQVDRDEWNRLLQARERLFHWESVKKTENVHRLIQTILHDSGYSSVLLTLPNGEQAALNVEKLLDIARECDGQGMSLFEFLEWIETLRAEDVQETEAEWIRDRGNSVVLMTVHASKGLEFPVVVLPELSRKLMQGSGGGPRALYVPGKGLAVKKFRESGEPEGDGLFDDLRKMEQDRELMEAYRLFYVAVTRARDYLLLAGSQSEQKKPSDQLKNNWLDWVIKHLGAKQLSELSAGEQTLDGEWSLKVKWDLEEESDEHASYAVKHESGGVPGEKVAAHYPLYAPLKLKNEPGDDVQSVTALMDYTYCPRLYVVKHRLKLPSASFGQKRADGEQPFSGLTAVQIGNVLHRVMERVEQTTQIDEQIKLACQAEGIDGSLHTTATAHIRPLIENYRRSEWYQESLQAKRIWNELPFYYHLGPHTVSGVIDKLFVNEHGEATILDFKTNQVRDDNQLQQLIASYKIQVHVYTAVARELLQLSVKRALLYFIQDDKPVNVGVDGLALHQLKREWSEALDEMHRLSHSKQLPHCTDESCYCRQYLLIE